MKVLKFIYILILSFTLFISSCGEKIDLQPDYLLTSDIAFQKVEDFQTAVNGMYSSMRSVSYYGRNHSVIPDMMTDNLTETGESLVNFRTVTDWVYTADDVTVSETWLGAYYTINAANTIIKNIDRFATTDNAQIINRFKGQALAIRGLVHFDLLRYFASDFDRNSTDLGVPFVTETIIATPARITVAETYDKILADLQEALRLLADVDAPINSATNRNKIDVTAVNAILARVSLYAKQYTEAASYATAVINALPLASRSNFPAIWKDETTAEVAWSVFFGAGEGGRLAGDVYSPVGQTRSQFKPSEDLLNLYDPATDIRFNTYFTAGSGSREGSFIATKYLGKNTLRDGIVNFKAFRTGEMYLIRAEAKALTNDGSGALDDLNTLRAARITGFVSGNESGQALLTAIATERRKELWLEGHRWFDLKRTSRSINRVDCGEQATACGLISSKREWTWPIPQGELQANPSMSGQQNEGY